MEIKMEADRALTILLHMVAHNLATTRKLADIVIATRFASNPDQGLKAMTALRSESEKSTQELLQALWASDGAVNIDDILGKNPLE